MNRTLLKITAFLGFYILLVPLAFLYGAQKFSLEDIMSTSFPSHLRVAPNGDSAAWVFNSQGKRNIWIATGPDYQPKKITSYQKDDGQEIGTLEFNHDSTMIVYVRGESANRSGEIPNPTSDPEGAEQAVWAVDIQNGEKRKIGRGSAPLCSPVDNKVIYSSHGEVFVSHVRKGPQPKVLFKARGKNRVQEWSPDGTKLCFVSQRENHSFIGIYDFKQKSIKWLHPSVEMDGYPVWSP